MKELYYYLDATPTHSYLKMLYKYPQAEFPYARLVRGKPAGAARISRNLSCSTPALFDDDRYFDVFVEYAKAAPDDILMRVTVHNRGPEAARISRCCRNCGSATPGRGNPNGHKPKLTGLTTAASRSNMTNLGNYRLDCDGEPTLLVLRQRNQCPPALRPD